MLVSSKCTVFITIWISWSKLKFGFRMRELKEAVIKIIKSLKKSFNLKHPDNVLVSNKFVDLLTVSSSKIRTYESNKFFMTRITQLRLRQLQVLWELETGQYELLHLSVDPRHHGGEGQLLGEGGGLQGGVLIGKAGGDVLVLYDAADLDRVVVVCLEDLQELLDPPLIK